MHEMKVKKKSITFLFILVHESSIKGFSKTYVPLNTELITSSYPIPIRCQQKDFVFFSLRNRNNPLNKVHAWIRIEHDQKSLCVDLHIIIRWDFLSLRQHGIWWNTYTILNQIFSSNLLLHNEYFIFHPEVSQGYYSILSIRSCHESI
jgi:hypothetical protein